MVLMLVKLEKERQNMKKSNASFFTSGSFDVKDLLALNLFDLSGKKTKTKGTSNKNYCIEINVNKTNNKAQIYCIYGAVGGTQTSYWMLFDDYLSAKKEYDKIIKSKKRKGYKEIDVAQRAFGSEEAKKITKAVQLTNVDPSIKKPSISLHVETQRLITELMGATNNFVIQTLKCPLGQLTNQQIEAGRDRLKEAEQIVAKARKSQNDKDRIEELTNDFYSLIPHNLGMGSRGQLTHLLLDSKDKINAKEYDLDTLLDAKAIGATLVSDSTYDQYASLDTNFNFIDHTNPLFKWIDKMIQHTRASNHRYLGKIVLLNAWEIERKTERDNFLKTTNKIAGECGKQVIPSQLKRLVPERTDVYDEKLFKNANVIPLFHGTRTQNITGILKKGILIRPSGVVITGAMYGSGAIYKSPSASKSINYTNIKTSYWAKGNDDKAYLFISDCTLGNQLMASGPRNYTLKNIAPNHSVWAKGGQSGVINDEMMLYRTDQHNLRYLLEFTCQKN